MRPFPLPVSNKTNAFAGVHKRGNEMVIEIRCRQAIRLQEVADGFF